ncbi:Zinc finger protein with KRAB and SCAN domains 8 [Larimichthys crocea]|nr:Zinc finger protein with KRAB and SCAN domains 8 [Larimichthys crocea]
MGSAPPLSSLRLLVPPLRLLTAAMWQVARQQNVVHYGMLEDFVSMVTEAVPQLLSDRQRSLLLLALRAKVTLCDVDPQAVHTQLDKVHSVCSQQCDEEVDGWCAALLTLTDKLTESPADRQRLLQEVFNQSFDSALQSLISDFLSRMEQLFPVPDFRQAASWLDAAPGGLEDCLQEADREDLKELLTNQSCLLGRATSTVGHDSEKILLSAWSHPLFTKLTNPDPPPSETEVQSDPLCAVDHPAQLDVELIKVEVVVMTEDEQDEVEETVIGQTASPVEHEASNESSALGDGDCAVTPVTQEVDRLKDSPGNFADQSGDTVDQSDQSCSEVTANALFSISHNSQRVAHKCPQCGKCFIYRSQVIRHLRTNKSCGSAIATSGAVNLQIQPDGHEEEPRPPEPRPPEPRLPEPRPSRSHSCFQCNAIFRSKAELLAHQRSHRARPSAKERDAHRLQHRLPDLTCTVCDQTFSSQTQLLRHLQVHSVEGADPCYNCRFCDQTFSGVTQLRIHQRTHTFRSYQCDQCSKTYGSLTGLHSHQASHTTESRFLCPQCGKRFKTRDGLEGHLRTHTGERPYRCPYCPKDFTALAGLNVHVRRHTGERPSVRPYACVYCPKSYTRKTHLNRHLQKHRTADSEVVVEEVADEA